MVENLFFNVYGTLSAGAPREEERAPAPRRAERPEAIREALAHIEEGGFTDAAVRAALLAARRGHRQRRLSTLKRVRDLVGKEVGLLDLPADEARAIIQRQSYIVDHEPERAMATLPELLDGPEERRRVLDLIERLASNLEINPQQVALLPEFRRLLAPETVVVTRPVTAIPRRQSREARR